MGLRNVYVIILIILSIQITSAVQEPGYIESVRYKQFAITNISPVEFYPSDIKTINITIQNIFDYSAFDVSMEIDRNKSEPIKFTHELQKYIASEVGPKQTITVQYQVYIGDSVPKGVYYIPITILWSAAKNGEQKQQDDFNIGITVAENPEVIKIDTVNITTIPEHFKAGDTFKLMVTLKNIGTTKLNQIRTSLSVGMPFSSVGSSTEQYIPLLEPGQSAVVLFNLQADKQAVSSLYNFNLTLEYKDNTNVLQSQRSSFGINVEEVAEAYIQDVTLDPTTLNPGTDGLLMVKIADAGTNEIENVRVTIFGGEKILTQSQNFIGIIRPGASQSETTSFGVHVDPNIENGDYGLNIQINYDDVNGKHHSKSNLFIVSIGKKSSLIPLSDQTISDILYAFIFTATSYGIFLIVGIRLDKMK
jgi:hypothetical protein